MVSRITSRFRRSRVQNVSSFFWARSAIPRFQQPDRVLGCCRPQVHIAASSRDPRVPPAPGSRGPAHPASPNASRRYDAYSVCGIGGTRTRPTCWKRAPTSGRSSSCWATPISRTPPSISALRLRLITWWMKQAESPFLTTSEAGRILDPPVTPAGVRAAAERGDLRVAARTHGGQRLFSLSDVEEFRQQRQREPQAAKK